MDTNEDGSAKPVPRHLPETERHTIESIVESVCEEPLLCRLGEARLPDRRNVQELIEIIRRLVFPGFFGDRQLRDDAIPAHIEGLAQRAAAHLRAELLAVLGYAHELELSLVADADPADDANLARDLAWRFLSRLPELRRLLALDVQASYDGDPAAVHTDETILCYPGVSAIFAHRIAHELHAFGVPLLPRIIAEMSHSVTGIDIHPGCRIGERFFVDHGGGVVIGETTVIGDSVRVYQGVTLGAKSFDTDERGRVVRTGVQRHPTIGNRVTIYAGAVILGGDTVVGDDCVISGSVFLTDSVPAGHVVRNRAPELVLRTPGAHVPLDGRRYTEAGG